MNLQTTVHLPQRHGDTEKTRRCRKVSHHPRDGGYVLCFFLILLSASVPLCLTAFLGAGAAGAEEKTFFTKHFKESLFNISEKGEFSIEILPDEKEYKIGKGVIGIVIHNKHDEDVEGADINIIVVDEQGRDIAGTPFIIKEKGEGLYTAANLSLGREGRWQLRINVKKKKIEDSAVFAFPDVAKERLPAGRYSP